MQPLRELSFWLRRTMSWSMPAWKRAVPLSSIRHSLDAAALKTLEARFDLTGWRCTEQDWRESLYVLDVLNGSLPKSLPDGRALDVGSKNGAYFPGLLAAQPREWDLVELDAHRRTIFGTTRRALGEAMVRESKGSRFIAGDVRTLSGPYAVITWFLPFLSEAPLDAWGLPMRELVPDQLLTHVVSLLSPGGALLIVNQGEHEAELQRALFERQHLEARSLGRIESRLSPFKKPRFGWLYVRGR